MAKLIPAAITRKLNSLMLSQGLTDGQPRTAPLVPGENLAVH